MEGRADDPVDFNYERFQLWNRCLPVKLDVGWVNVHEIEAFDAFASNLATKAEAVARGKLQDAGLYYPGPAKLFSPKLNMILILNPLEFEIHTSYMKKVTDTTTNESGYIMTWRLEETDPYFTLSREHDKDPEYILYWVDKHTDRFIEEYRRVNADACAQ